MGRFAFDLVYDSDRPFNSPMPQNFSLRVWSSHSHFCCLLETWRMHKGKYPGKGRKMCLVFQVSVMLEKLFLDEGQPSTHRPESLPLPGLEDYFKILCLHPLHCPSSHHYGKHVFTLLFIHSYQLLSGYFQTPVLFSVEYHSP